jgi:hypothetical protein
VAGGKLLLAACFHAGFLLDLFFALKIEAICSSEMSVDFQRITRCYIPEDRTIYNYLCGNLNTYKLTFIRNLHVIHPTIYLYVK